MTLTFSSMILSATTAVKNKQHVFKCDSYPSASIFQSHFKYIIRQIKKATYFV